MLLAVLLAPSLLLIAAPQAPSCADVESCRRAALDAAAQGDFEAFHDLAWRAVQRGTRNDPDLMSLLARAQSLSGRPGDALVMLRRLAEIGGSTDADEHEDFQRVRALAGWPEVEALLAAAGKEAAASPAAASPAAASPAAPAATEAAGRTPPPGRGPPAAAAAAPSPVLKERAIVAVRGGREAFRLVASPIQPIGLAYDSASRRFVIGDRRADKLVIADEVFNHVNDLIGAASAGFGRLTALAIDERRGDLWVTSSEADGAASIHKLQLVSGRVLTTVSVPEALRPAAFSDIAVTDGGALLLADRAGFRLLTMKTHAGGLEGALQLSLSPPSSVATTGQVAYVAHDAGISVADMPSGRLAEMRASPGVTLGGLQRIRWHRGSLIAIQQGEDTVGRLVRIRLNRGGVATAVEPLDDYPASEGSALTISRDAAYYVAEAEGDPVIRRVELR